VGASLDFIIFSALTIRGGIYHLTANIISVSAGIVTNFFLNYFFNFKSQGNMLLRLLSFYAVGISGLFFSLLLLWLLIDYARFPVLPVKAATIFLVTVVQYTLNKTISFRRSRQN
jgi:putative flippase GtrA